jgi:adenine-specific DNA-methyltransferase
MMDEVFGRDQFVGTIVWEKADTLRNDATQFSASHDYILVYSRDPSWRANKLPRTEEMNKVYKNPDNDPRGPWLASTLISPSFRASGDFEVVTPSGARHRAPDGTSWRVPKETFDRLLADGRIWFGKRGDATPQRKLFLSEAGDRVVDTVWKVKDVGGNRQSKAEIKKLFPHVVPFATPKPERLIHRIIHVATDPDDIVLDCFAGSGTTAAVAQKMGRRWVTSEWSRETLETFTGPRLEKVVAGDDPGGVTELAGWKGGGGFRVLDVAPSMFEDYEGQVLLAEWVVETALNETTAAQLGYEYDPDLLPFAGRKGRVRLAVVDGLVNDSVARLLVGQLPEGERLCLCATMVDPAVRDVLRELRPGSTLRKIPESILADYRQEQLWWDRHADTLEEVPEAEANGGAAAETTTAMES